MINTQVDTSELDRVLRTIPPAVQTSVRQELTTAIAKVQEEARRTHRHKTRSGALSRSLQTKVSDKGDVAELFIEDALAEYGLYVVQGHGSWGPDQFLEDALAKKETEIVQGIERSVEHAINGAL